MNEGRAAVIVVGGGPAGAMAAIRLGCRGVSTLVLDKKRFPRDKPCGGGIRYGVLDRFPDLGDLLGRAVETHAIRRVLMESPSGAAVRAELERPLYLTVRRLELDAALLARARAAGAEVVERVRVTAVEPRATEVVVHSVDGRAFAGQVVIGADGVNGVVARAAGLTRGFPDEALALDTMEETELGELSVPDADTIYVAYGYRGHPGYGYVFPKARHVDAGVGFLLPFFKTRLGGDAYGEHVRFLDAARDRGLVRGRSNRANFKAYRLPLGGPLPRTYADRVLVCGDAGGFVNAYTGEGIYYALVTGEHAGETAAAAVTAGDASARALAAYEARWRAEIGEELAESLRIQRRLFANPRLADAIIRAAALDGRLRRLLARVALGETRLRGHRLELAARFALATLRGLRRSGATNGPPIPPTLGAPRQSRRRPSTSR